MSNTWFGEPWPSADYRAPICEDDNLRIPVPVGEFCVWCQEPIVENDRGTCMMGMNADETWQRMYAHIECGFMNVTGPIAFHEGRCKHAGGADPCHDPNMTYRQEALLRWAQNR